MKVICDYCNRPAKFVTGAKLYPHRPDLIGHKFWYCEPCDAYVGVHQRNKKLGFNGDEPKGRLANKELRRMKMAAHAKFDPMWKSGKMTRTDAYAWLAKQLGISDANMHIGMFDIDGCKAVISAMQNNMLIK
jgi:hypothetical protein